MKCPGPLPDFCHCQFCSRSLLTSTTWLLPTVCVTHPPHCAQGRKPHYLRSQEGFLGSLSTHFFFSDKLGHGHGPFLAQDSADDLQRWMTLFRNTVGLMWLMWSVSSSSHESETSLPHRTGSCDNEGRPHCSCSFNPGTFDVVVGKQVLSANMRT